VLRAGVSIKKGMPASLDARRGNSISAAALSGTTGARRYALAGGSNLITPWHNGWTGERQT